MEINRFLAYGPLIVLLLSILATAGFSMRAVSELKKGSENLKDMNFMMGNTLRYRNDFLRYEKKLLDDWFKETF